VVFEWVCDCQVYSEYSTLGSSDADGSVSTVENAPSVRRDVVAVSGPLAKMYFVPKYLPMSAPEYPGAPPAGATAA
jgi:hypothetical protein